MTLTTRQALAARRMKRDMLALGYEKVRGPWDLVRGGRWRHVIIDCKIDAYGKDLWVKVNEDGQNK